MNNDEIEKIIPNPEKNIKVFMGGGVYLVVTPQNTKRWRFKYRYGGKEKLLSLGLFPAISSKIAYKMAEEYKQLVREGIDPSFARKKERKEKADQQIEEMRKWNRTKNRGAHMADTKDHESLAVQIYAGFVRDYFNDGFIWQCDESESEPPDFARMRETAWDAAEAFYGFL